MSFEGHNSTCNKGQAQTVGLDGWKMAGKVCKNAIWPPNLGWRPDGGGEGVGNE